MITDCVDSIILKVIKTHKLSTRDPATPDILVPCPDDQLETKFNDFLEEVKGR